MTYTLGQITHMVARELQILSDGIATGGTTSQIADTNLRTEANDYWNKGCAWIWYDAGGAGAAPEYEFSVISDFATTGGIISLRNSLTAAVAAGDKYSVCKKIADTTWLDMIIQKVNQALIELGPIPQADTTTLTIAANQTEYSLPITANMDIRRVSLQQTIDADDNAWQEIFNWYKIPATPGNSATLVLPWQEYAGYDLMLEYLDYHPEMQVATDVMSDHVPVERVVYPAALECARWRKEMTGWNRWDDLIGRLELKTGQAELRRPVNDMPQKPGRTMLIDWADARSYPGDRNPR